MRRPHQLSGFFLIVLLAASGLSLVSGLVIWWANSRALDVDAAALNVRPWVIVHGSLNPLLCGLFGYLLACHVRGGWRAQKNRASGAILLAVFGGLIITGPALYYAGGEPTREIGRWTHRLLGVLFPIAIAMHGWGSYRAAKPGQETPSLVD